MVGGAFTATRKLFVVDNPPALVTVSAMVDVPFCPAAAVTVTVRAAPDPPSTTFADGTNVVLLDVLLTVSAVAGVTVSFTVKANEGVVAPMANV